MIEFRYSASLEMYVHLISNSRSVTSVSFSACDFESYKFRYVETDAAMKKSIQRRINSNLVVSMSFGRDMVEKNLGKLRTKPAYPAFKCKASGKTLFSPITCNAKVVRERSPVLHKRAKLDINNSGNKLQICSINKDKSSSPATISSVEYIEGYTLKTFLQ